MRRLMKLSPTMLACQNFMLEHGRKIAVTEAELQALQDRVEAIVSRLSYKPDTGFLVSWRGITLLLYHWQWLSDSATGEKAVHHSRKYYISPHMTDEEIIRTAALAVKVFEEHEANEWLRLDGERVLNPHPEGPRPQLGENNG